MASELHANGWMSVPVSAANEEWAKRTRAERDRRFGNIYEERETDVRWVGDLGELAFSNWLKYEGLQGYSWELDWPAGAADFVIRGAHIGVKTVKRKDAPKEGYTAQITAQHAHEPVDQFFFMCYEMGIRRMWLLGGITRPAFLDHAIYYGPGDQVHAHYVVREGHEIFNMDLRYLTAPKRWIDQFR